MKKSMVVIGAFVLMSFVVSEACFAQLINYNRRNRTGAPANTGYRTPRNPAPAPAAHTPTTPAPSTPAPAAAKEEAYGAAMNNVLLKDVVTVVNKNGSYKVNSPILQKYDKNNDGMIGKAELKALEADIR